jgi:hypothetical protein
MYTLAREFQIGVKSKHSSKFHFEEFSHFIEAIKETVETDKSLTLLPLEEFFLRIKFYAKRQSRAKDTFFWIAHAKLLR